MQGRGLLRAGGRDNSGDVNRRDESSPPPACPHAVAFRSSGGALRATPTTKIIMPPSTAVTAAQNELACQLCGRRPCAVVCRGCGALAWCSAEHHAAHAKSGQHDAAECARMAEQCARRDEVLAPARELLLLPLDDRHHCCCCRGAGAGVMTLSALCPLHGTDACGNSTRDDDDDDDDDPTRWPALPTDEAGWRRAWGDDDGAPPWRAADVSTSSSTSSGSDSSGGGAALSGGWRAYCEWRGLRRTPALPALLAALHFPLALLHVLTVLLPARGWPLPLPHEAAPLVVAYLGARVELRSLLPAFAELALLLPRHSIELLFVGPDVPSALHGKSCSSSAAAAAAGCGGRLTVRCWCGCWHDAVEDWAHAAAAAAATTEGAGEAAAAVAADEEAEALAAAAAAAEGGGWRESGAPPPALVRRLHCVFAPNAGLPAFPSWAPTLRALLDTPPSPAAAGSCGVPVVPVVFTDRTEEAALMSVRLIEKGVLGGGGARPQQLLRPPQLHPFRGPLADINHGSRLPSCSGAWVFGWT